MINNNKKQTKNNVRVGKTS